MKLVHFFRYDNGKYHEFSLIHYISIRSFLICCPEVEVILWMNIDPYDSIWYHQLMEEFPDRIKVDLAAMTKDKSEKWIDDFNCISHFIDWFKLKVLYNAGGLSVDTDVIALKDCTWMIDDKIGYIAGERDPLSHKFTQIALGIASFPVKCEFVDEWFKLFNEEYHQGAKWTEFSGKRPTELLNDNRERFSNIKVLPESLIDPVTYTRDALADLFLHNRISFKSSYMIHVSESIAWDRYLKPLDLEHIMTVDTVFTKTVRPFVSHLWDASKCAPVIRV